ncbi:MAG: GreA/GreB family elongation factor [Candidatus Binatia bacterium]
MDLPIVQRLKKELQELQHELSHRLPKELEEARAHGDLSENAEYEAAKARQEIVQSRISQLGGRIRELSMYTLSSIPEGVAAYGSRVTVEDLDEGETIGYRLVFPEEADVSAGDISIGSPLGRALVNRKVGDEVEVVTPKGKRHYQVVELVTIHENMEK